MEAQEDNAYMQALELQTGIDMNMTLRAAIELGILQTIVGAGEGAMLTAGEIAGHLPTANPEAPNMVDRMLRLLAAHNIVTCVVEAGADGRPECKYGAAPVCKYFTGEGEMSLSRKVLLATDMVTFQSW